MAIPRPIMSRPLRRLLDNLRPLGCAFSNPKLAEEDDDFDLFVLNDRDRSFLEWHIEKHRVDREFGRESLAAKRLQIAHVADLPTVTANMWSVASGPPLRFHTPQNLILLCPEAHDIYDKEDQISLDMAIKASNLVWFSPHVVDPLLAYLKAIADPPRERDYRSIRDAKALLLSNEADFDLVSEIAHGGRSAAST
ncbi:hypothetical protein ACFQ2M_42435 [Kitasatospora saccharophila]|uniref:hypothetical protein n=1 Tax=Kitasatospora saccharophila TaxID=407973 RepID=UPI003637FE86